MASDDHHDPLADARMAASVGCLALQETGNTNLTELLTSIKALMGSMTAGEWAGCRLRDVRAAIPDTPSPGAELNADHPLYGKTVAFTGALSIPRREAQQAIVDCGAIAGKGVTRRTDMLVTGFQDLTKLAAGKSKSAKLRKAEKLVTEGCEIEIVAEGDFVKSLAQ